MSTVGGTYGDDVLDHGVGGGQAGPQQVRHNIYDLLVQLREPDNQQLRVIKRCRLTNSALVYESKCGGGGSCGVSANELSYVHHVTRRPNKLWKSNSIFNLC
jgi:hypothetical protein